MGQSAVIAVLALAVLQGCLALGVALVRLIPPHWLLVSVVAMCAVDVALLAVGVGETATAQMANATAQFHGPVFDRAGIGPIALDYPDLILAAVLGCWVAGQPCQRRAAVLLMILTGLYGMLLSVADVLPATIPVAVAFVQVRYGHVPHRSQGIRLGRAGTSRRATARAGAEPA